MERFAGRDQWKPVLNFDFKNCNKFRILSLMTIKEILDGFHERNAINPDPMPYLI